MGGGGTFTYSEEPIDGGEEPWNVQFSPVRTAFPAGEGEEEYENEDEDDYEDEDDDARFANLLLLIQCDVGAHF